MNCQITDSEAICGAVLLACYILLGFYIGVDYADRNPRKNKT